MLKEKSSHVVPLLTLMLVMYVYMYFPTYMGIDNDDVVTTEEADE